MDAALFPQAYRSLVAGPVPVTLVDVRRADAFALDPVLMPGAVRRTPDDVLAWGPTLPAWRPVVVYCAHGGDVGRDVAQTLRALGLPARFLAGGLDAWRELGGDVEPQRAPTRWVTRERPRIDRIACPWFIWCFVDADAVVDYVPAHEVLAHAAATGAMPFDVPDVAYSHAGERCSFDAFIARHARGDSALEALADIVRAADTDRLEDAPQAAGLLAVSLGLARLIALDHTLLHHGLLVYDALYAWCRDAQGERRGWDPYRLRSAA